MMWETAERTRKIIIADSDSVQRWLLRTTLAQAGYEIFEATNGLDAWHLVEQETAQIVIANWAMPDMDGLALIRKIRAACHDRYVYILLLSASNTSEDIVRGLEAGADDYVVKPFQPEELCARVATSQRILKLEAHLRESRDHERMLASHDSLTGLHNRRAIFEYAEIELARAIRDGTPLSAILIDIDHFKEVNDQHGHLIGDQVLYLVAATIAHNKRPTDWVGRWGGEEFLLVLPDTTLEEAGVVAERIRTNIAAARLPLHDGYELRRTVSLGVASITHDAAHPLELMLQQADRALYRSKEDGRNRLNLYTNNHELVCDTP